MFARTYPEDTNGNILYREPDLKTNVHSVIEQPFVEFLLGINQLVVTKSPVQQE